MKEVSLDEKGQIRNEFLEQLGAFIRQKRTIKNISLKELAEFLNVSESTMSRYETGKSDMVVSNLPLMSLFCDFLMSEYFTDRKIQQLLSEFQSIVVIKRKQYQREEKRKQTIRPEKQLVAHVYYADGVETIEYISERPSLERAGLREEYIRGGVDLQGVQPFTNEEFIEYLRKERNIQLIKLLDGVGMLLDYIGNAPKKETIKSHLADFTINSLIVDKIISDNNLEAMKAYMYYKELLQSSVEGETDNIP